MFKKLFLTLFLTYLCSVSALLSATPVDGPSQKESSKILTLQILPGNTLAVEISASDLSSFSPFVKFNDKAYPFFEHPKIKNAAQRKLIALIPMPFETTSGSHQVEIWSKTSESESSAFLIDTLSFTVKKDTYRTIVIKVAEEKTNLSPENKKRADLEWEKVKKIFSESKQERLWNDPFTNPIDASVTSEFGVKRMFNKTVQSFHRGLDLRAAPRTKIHASNAGIVRLAENLFYAGNQVIIDHGFGIFSSYAHLSKILVEPGQLVKRGDVVGLSGDTGRVSGPHLHWGVSLSGFSVDPSQFKKAISILFK